MLLCWWWWVSWSSFSKSYPVNFNSLHWQLQSKLCLFTYPLLVCQYQFRGIYSIVWEIREGRTRTNDHEGTAALVCYFGHSSGDWNSVHVVHPKYSSNAAMTYLDPIMRHWDTSSSVNMPNAPNWSTLRRNGVITSEEPNWSRTVFPITFHCFCLMRDHFSLRISLHPLELSAMQFYCTTHLQFNIHFISVGKNCLQNQILSDINHVE